MPDNRKMMSFRLDPLLIERVDRVRGDTTRTAWLEAAIDRYLAESEEFKAAPTLGDAGGQYQCPTPGCDYSTQKAGVSCPWHGRATR